MTKPRNLAVCLCCGTILESKHRHDYQVCPCPNHTSVDGGSDYVRGGGMDLTKARWVSSMEAAEKLVAENRPMRYSGQTYFAVDPAYTGEDECAMTLVQYVAPGQVTILAYSAGPDYTPPDRAASLDALYKLIRCPPQGLTKEPQNGKETR